MDEIWKEALDSGAMREEIIDCNLDIALQYRHNAGRELLRLWELWIDDKFKKTKNKLDHEATKKINALYQQLKDRLEHKNETRILEESKEYIEMARNRTGVKTGVGFLDAKIGFMRAGTITRLS